MNTVNPIVELINSLFMQVLESLPNEPPEDAVVTLDEVMV